MSNEFLFLIAAFSSIIFTFVAARLGTRWLFGVVLLNLILITIFGAKLITVFGFVSNMGNVFYACVFLATHFLLIRGARKDAIETIWFGAGFIAIFILMSQFVVETKGIESNDSTYTGLDMLFSVSLRTAFASIIAYLFAQWANIRIYEWIAIRTKGKFLWLQSNGANVCAQFLDSVLFFTLAFVDLPAGQLVQAIITGWILKTFIVFLGIPFLYLERAMVKRN